MKKMVRSFWISAILLFAMAYQINAKVNSVDPTGTYVDNGTSLNVTNFDADGVFGGSDDSFHDLTFDNPAQLQAVCTGNVPIQNLPSGMNYSIVSGADGNVAISLTVVDNPAGLVGFFGGAGNPISFPNASGTFTYTLTGQTVGATLPINMFFNWAAGGQGNSTTFSIVVGNCTAPPTVCSGNVPIQNLTSGMNYTIVSGADGNVAISLTVVDNPAGLVGFFGGAGNPISFPNASGTFTYTLTGQTVGATLPINMFFNWAAGGQGNSTTFSIVVGNCTAPPTVCSGNVPIQNLTSGMNYTIVSGADGNVAISLTVVDNPPGLVGFFGGAGNPISFPNASGTFTYTLTGQTIGNSLPINMFFNWAAGGQGNSTAIPFVIGDCPVPGATVNLCIDLSCYPNPPASVNIFGLLINGWCPTCTPLTDPDGDGIYCHSQFFTPGQVEYKFLVNGTEESFTPGDPCTLTSFGFTNRVITVVDGVNQSVTYGFERCDGVCTPPPAQPTLPITFEDPASVTNYNIGNFGGAIGTIAPDPTDPTNTVLCVNKTPGAQPWAGNVIGDAGLAAPIPFTATHTTMTARVWAPAAGIPVLLKLERTTGGPTAEVLATTTTAGWQTLVWDMSTSTIAPFSLNNVYNKVVVFFDFGTNGNGQIYYIDDILLCGVIPAPTTSVAVNTCDGATTRAITVNTPAPTAGTTYTLMPGGTTNTTGIFEGLAAGSYTVMANINGCVTEVAPINIPTMVTPPTPLTVNACESYDNEIQHWLATIGGATINHQGRIVECYCNDYCAPHAWQYLDNCSKNAILPVRFTVKYTDGSTFEFCSVINKIDPQVVTFLTPPQDLVLNCSGNNQAAQVQAWLNDNGGAIAQLCEGYIYHSNNYSGALPIGCNSSVPVTFTITNECGLSTSAVANISLIDNTPPLLSGLPANTTINCGDAIPAAPTVTATDACTPNVAVNLSQWVATISGNLSGANEVPANNSSASGRVFAQLTGNSLQIVVAFNGLTAPASAAHIHEAAAGANGPVRIDLVGLGFPVGATNGVFTTSVTLTAALQAALAAGNLYVNIHNPSFPGGELRAQLRSQCTNTTVRVWSASDACNNSAIAMRTISETDTQAPTFTSVPASTIIACNGTVVLGTATATDACSAATVTFSDVTTGTVCTGVTTTRTFRATDGCGNTATAVQSVTKSADTAAPTFTFVPANNTFACGGTPFLGTATATDACSSVTVTFVDSQGAGNCSGASSIRTFRATDGCGNSATATQESTPEVDVVPPTFGPLTEVIEIVCGDAVVFETATTSDNCTAVTVTFTDEVNGDVCAGIMNIRRWTATDACGNTATAKQTVWQIGDTTDPEYTNMLEDEAVYFCGETPDYDGVGAVDGCGGDVTVSYEIDYDYEDYCYDGYGYYSKVRYTAVDACGNENHETITSHFVPEDHRMAFMYKPVSKTVTCSEAYTFDAVYPKVVSYDGAISSVTYTDIANLTPCGSGTITRRWTATDVVGNSAIAEQTVTILPDTELPTFVLANNSVVVSCATAITVQAPLVSDNCSTSDAITLTYTDVNVENTVQRTWSAADACGNVANATQIYIILDTQAPVFTTALQNKTINCGAPVIFDNAVAADACSAVTMSYADTQLAINCGTEHTRTWTASDAVGNASTILQKITVVDNAAPIFSYVPANVQVASANLVSFGTPQVADVCQIVQLTFSDVQTTPICANTGYTVTRTWVANDGCNNQAVASQQISVALDAQAPAFSATLVDQTIAFGEQVVFTTLTATDNNGTPTLTYQDVQGAPVCGNSGYTVTRTWTAMDACNNAAEAVQHISVGLDVEAPVFASLLESKTIDCGGLIAFDNPVVTDNSSNFALTYTDAQTTPTCGNSGYTMTRTYTALDVCNNAAQVAQSIYVAEDTEAPVFVGTVNDMEMTQYAFSTWVPMAPAAADNCQALEVLIGTAINVDACNYKVDYTATDACGNFVIRTQNIHIVDCLVLGTNEGVLSSVNIYPNPTETELNIVMSSEVDLKDITAQVFDMLGKQVAMTQVTQHQSNINVSTLAAGTYTLRLTAEGGVKSVKFVKQ